MKLVDLEYGWQFKEFPDEEVAFPELHCDCCREAAGAFPGVLQYLPYCESNSSDGMNRGRTQAELVVVLSLISQCAGGERCRRSVPEASGWRQLGAEEAQLNKANLFCVRDSACMSTGFPGHFGLAAINSRTTSQKETHTTTSRVRCGRRSGKSALDFAM
eukprot:3229799-Rhodomonas_salina.1